MVKGVKSPQGWRGKVYFTGGDWLPTRRKNFSEVVWRGGLQTGRIRQINARGRSTKKKPLQSNMQGKIWKSKSRGFPISNEFLGNPTWVGGKLRGRRPGIDLLLLGFFVWCFWGVVVCKKKKSVLRGGGM